MSKADESRGVCKHDVLRRSCDYCDLEEELLNLREEQNKNIRLNEIDRRLSANKLALEVVPVNQVKNGYGRLVDGGDMPLITYTASIYNQDITAIKADQSFDSFIEALEWAAEWCENSLKN